MILTEMLYPPIPISGLDTGLTLMYDLSYMGVAWTTNPDLTLQG